MKLKTVVSLIIVGLCCVVLVISCSNASNRMPNDFVYLRDIDPTIIQEMRYAGYHNFVGRSIKGYYSAECILTKPAAKALSQVQRELLRSSLSLKVYDCYRPTMAVEDFIGWSEDPTQQQMKEEFYPRVDKKDFFKLGYVAAKSSHSRGSTMDLTIVRLPPKHQPTYHIGQRLVACYAPYSKRFADNSIDMGVGFDCFDELSHPLNKDVNDDVYHNRMMLRHLMEKYGFVPYDREWWHFTLKDEPYPETYFNFPIVPR